MDGIGIKELWEIAPEKHRTGLVIHTACWPLDVHTYGGGLLCHMESNQVAVGLTTGAGYSNPYLSPFEEFQRLKTHPARRGFFAGGKRIAYGARNRRRHRPVTAQACVPGGRADRWRRRFSNIVWVAPQGGEGPNYPNM